MKLYKKITLCVAILLLIISQLVFAVTPAAAADAELRLPDITVNEKPLYSLPDSMSAVRLLTGTDFAAAVAISSENGRLLDSIASAGADTVILETSANGKSLLPLYSDALLAMCDSAKSKGFAVYITADVSALTPSGGYAERLDGLCARLSDMAYKYPADGFIVCGLSDVSDYGDYLSAGAGVGADAWRKEYPLLAARYACATLRSCSNALLTGVECSDSIDTSELAAEGISDFIITDNMEMYTDVPAIYNNNESTALRRACRLSELDGSARAAGGAGRLISMPDILTVMPDGRKAVRTGESFEISVQAASGMELRARFNGREIPLAENPDAGKGYSLYNGSMTAGEECIASRVYIFASENELRLRLTGALITVSRGGTLMLGADERADDDVVPAGVIHTEEYTVPNSFRQSGRLVRITEESALSFNPICSEKLIASPDYPRLAVGMLDYLSGEKTITERGTEMYILSSGRMVKKSSAEILYDGSIGENKISAEKVHMDGEDTVLEFSQTARTPYSMSLENFEYHKNIYGDWGDYFVEDYSPTALRISFDYCERAEGLFSFPDSALFDGCEWTTDAATKRLTLRLSLREGERFCGVSVGYTEDGSLRFRFNHLESAVRGMTIVVDPGHGYLAADNYDPGAIGRFGNLTVYEADINLALSLFVTKKLEERGATVIRFDTEKTPYDTFKRSDIARRYNPDLFIAIHSDAYSDTLSHGNSAYYFTPFSARLAQTVADRIGEFFSAALYNGEDRSKGDYYDYFAVTTQHDFPSILIESGFVTNYKEATTLMNPANQDRIAESIVKGIEDYLED